MDLHRRFSTQLFEERSNLFPEPLVHNKAKRTFFYMLTIVDHKDRNSSGFEDFEKSLDIVFRGWIRNVLQRLVAINEIEGIFLESS